MARRRGGWISIFVCGLLISGCASGTNDVKAEKESLLATTCKVVSPYLSALSDPDRTGAVGTFGDVPDFATNLSFYNSAWNVLSLPEHPKMLRGLRNMPIQLMVENHFDSNSEGKDATDVLSPLTVRALAFRADKVLRPEASLPSTAFSEWLSGDRYLESENSNAAIDMTPVVVSAIAAYGLIPPTSVTDAAYYEVQSNLGEHDIGVLAGELIPKLYVATLAPQLDETQIATLRRALNGWSQVLPPMGANALTLSTANYLQMSTRKLGEPSKVLSSLLKATFTSDDISSLIRGDAQALYNAQQLGLTDKPLAEYLLFRGSTINGWLDSVSAPSLRSTFHAAVIFSACGGRLQTTSDQIRAWSAELKTTNDPQLSAYQICFINAVRQGESHNVSASCPKEWQAWAEFKPKNSRETIAVTIAKAKTSGAGLRDDLARYESGGQYSTSPRASKPDLPGTALAASVLGNPEHARRASLMEFESGSLWSLEADQDTTSLLSLMFAVVLASGRFDIARAAAAQ